MWTNYWNEYGLWAIKQQPNDDWIEDTELALDILEKRDALLHDCIFEPHQGDDYLAALWGARLILSALVMEKMEIAVVMTNSEAPSDKELASFSLELPHPFEIELWGGIADFDGVIKWREPIPFMDWQGNFKMHKAREYVPVEVGECHPMKIWTYLVQCGYLARYPYRWKQIVIFYLHESVRNEIFDKILSKIP